MRILLLKKCACSVLTFASAAYFQESDPNSANAQKKAAKKAAKKAVKQSYKEGGTPEVAAVATAVPPTVPATAAPAKVAPPSKVAPTPAPATTAVGGLEPFQVAINPNVPLVERPVVALAVAVLTDTNLDLDIISDHRRAQTAMGLPASSEGISGGSSLACSVLVGDFAMARYLARRSARSASVLPVSPEQVALVDAWVDYAQSLMRLEKEQRFKAVQMTLQHALGQTQTYLVGTSLTLADLCLFKAIGFPTQAGDLAQTMADLHAHATAARRWIFMMAQHPALQEATQLCVGIVNNEEAVFDESNVLEPLVSGMDILEGAVAGRVVTRFPPEPSGYLHIGHSKAVLLNDYYARRYKGRLILRFDDTNPDKESMEFEQSIVVDLGRLGVKPDLLTYTSDYFEVLTEYARQMIRDGLAFMDDTPQEQMKIERGDRQDSKHRNQSPEDAMKYFDLMCSGSQEGASWCLRAKIDMKSDNGTMRDPVLFRQNLTPHHRSGTRFKAYPTYDLACPIVDSIEGVTHALRTTEYDDRNEQYQWIQRALGIRRVHIHTFSRVNFVNTVLSKRKLTWFVQNGYVTGWDDARFPTVRGVVRRGINITALRNFMLAQGASRRVVLMDWTVFWSENKKEIDKLAKRYMAVDQTNNIKLVVTNGPKAHDYAYMIAPCHPKDPSLGDRVVRICNEVLLEAPDVEGVVVGETIVLMRWGVVKITKVGEVLEGEYIPDGDFKAAPKKLSWIAAVSDNTPTVLTEFDNLLSKDKIDEDEDFVDFINPHTMACTDAIGDAGLKTLQEHDVIQLERRGYFRVDRPYVSKDKPLILHMIPDGKAKAMSGQAGKLAHR